MSFPSGLPKCDSKADLLEAWHIAETDLFKAERVACNGLVGSLAHALFLNGHLALPVLLNQAPCLQTTT